MIALWLAVALGGEFRVAREGDTIEALSERLELNAVTLRKLNDLAGKEQPAVGQLLEIPSDGEHVHQVGYVIALTGSGTMRAPQQAEAPLALGAELPAGTTVCTEVGSFATVRLAADAATGIHDDVSLLAETCILIRGLSTRPNARSSTVEMASGSVSVRSADGDGELSVLTRDGITTGRLGGFRVTLEERASRTEALYADVAVIGAEVERRVPSGFGARVTRGQQPTETTPLLPPGQPIAPKDGTVLRRHDFDWSPVDRALGYRVEFARSADFSDIVLVEELDTEAWRPDYLALPQPARSWYWRIATFDRLGYLGIPSEGHQAMEPIPQE